MKPRFLNTVRFLCVLFLVAWVLTLRAIAQTPLGLSIQMNAGRQAQLAVTGAEGTACQIQWTDSLSSTSCWYHLKHCVLTSSPTLMTDWTSSLASSRYYRAVWVPNTNLVWISPGTFTMGSPSNEVDRTEYEGPLTVVILTRGFWMGKYEVTQGEYQAVMGSVAGCRGGDLTQPVGCLPWPDATNYCAVLTEQELVAGRIPADCVYRLPTEAEWEYACRAGTTTRFHYGDDPGYTNLVRYAWFGGDSTTPSHPVGRKLPNQWGLYDMLGNALEWCQDWWSDYLPGGTVVDPQGLNQTSMRPAIRGGVVHAPASYCRSAWRDWDGWWLDPPLAWNLDGFRVVLAPGQP